MPPMHPTYTYMYARPVESSKRAVSALIDSIDRQGGGWQPLPPGPGRGKGGRGLDRGAPPTAPSTRTAAPR